MAVNKKKHKATPEERATKWLVGIGLILLIISFIGLLCGCRTVTRTIEVPVVMENTIQRVDTLRLMTYHIDTIVARDSISVIQKGDTVTKEVIKWRYKTKVFIDTCLQTRVDSIYIEKPVTITKEIEKQPTIGQKVKESVCVLLSIILLVLICLGIWRIKKHKQ